MFLCLLADVCRENLLGVRTVQDCRAHSHCRFTLCKMKTILEDRTKFLRKIFFFAPRNKHSAIEVHFSRHSTVLKGESF